MFRIHPIVLTVAVTVISIGGMYSCRGGPRGGSEIPLAHPDSSELMQNSVAILVQLRDGSTLKGKSLTDSLMLETNYASLTLAISIIRSIQIRDTNRGVTISLENGDRLNGVLKDKAISIKSLLGPMTIPFREVTSISVHLSGVPSDSGLVAWYPFRGSPEDHSGHSRDGTVKGATLCADRFGVANNAYEFGGNDSRIELPDGIVKYDTPEFTISAWLKTPNMKSGEIAVYLGASEGEMVLEALDNRFFFCVNAGGGQQFARTSAPLATWFHAVGVYRRGGSCQIWINGELRTSTPVPEGDLEHGFPGHHSAIGSYAPAQFVHARAHHIGSWLGAIDEVRMYNHALSAEEIRILANE